MSDQDFILVDEEDKEKENNGQDGCSKEEQKQEVVSSDSSRKDGSSSDQKDDDGYEKVCFICHRPESVTGKMIDLPNNITVCPDCMQRSFDAMTNGSVVPAIKAEMFLPSARKETS